MSTGLISAGSSVAWGWARKSPRGLMTVTPSRLMAARCSPRATRWTSAPPRCRAAPTYAPIAPAPTTATLIRPPSLVHQRGQVAALDLARRPLRDLGQDGDAGRPLERGEAIRAVGDELLGRGPACLPRVALHAAQDDDDAY